MVIIIPPAQSSAQVAAAIAAASGDMPFVETVDGKVIPSATTVGANFLICYRVRVNKALTVATATWFVGTANGNLDVGLYTSDGSTLTLAASTGSTAAAGTNALQTANLDTSVPLVAATDYYIGLITDSATLALGRIAGLAVINNLDKIGIVKAVTYATDSGLPSSATLASLSTGILPTTWIRLRP